jgi:hypothetical protein
VDEHASLVVADRQMSIEHVAKLGRSSLLNPSCPPMSSDAEHAKKHELVRAQLADRAKRKRELTNYARLKKPAICQIEMDFLAQASLGTDAKAIPDDQHPDHQLGIDRWSTHSAVKGSQLAPQLAKLDEPVDRPQEVVSRNVLFKRKRIKKLLLIMTESPHHGPLPSRIASQLRNHRLKKPATDFRNKIGPFRRSVPKICRTAHCAQVGISGAASA